MSWTNGSYPAVYRNQPVRLRQKAVEIANNLMMNGIDENRAIKEGLERAREFFLSEESRKSGIDSRLPALP
jgi:uncharacterized protein YdaT